MSDQARWEGWLVQYPDAEGETKEIHVIGAWQGYEVAARYPGAIVCGVRRRSELRQGQPAYELVPVDREGRAL